MASEYAPGDPVVVWAVGDRVLVTRLQVPLRLAQGRYEQLTDEELNDHASDINAELARRSEQAVP